MKNRLFVLVSAFATVLFVASLGACSNSGDTPFVPSAASEPATTSDPAAGGGTQTSPTGPSNPTTPTQTPSPTPTQTPDNPNGGNGGQQQQDQADQFGGKPYDATIGNGGYNLHTFMGANTTFDSKEKADYYIGEAETYVKGLANQLSESTKNRPAAQAYFQKLFNEVQHSTTHYYGDGESFDIIINNVSRGAAQVMGDITKNTANEDQAYDFQGLYRTIANEALKAGAGNAFEGSDSASRYNTEKKFVLELADDMEFKQRLNIDLPNAYENNDFTDVTNYIDTVLTTAATKIGHDVTADDLRKVVNIAMTTESFYALHSRTKTALDHWKAGSCNVDFGKIKYAIDPARYTYAMLNKQDNGMELC